ncbi:excinuclease ABC subunit UvrC, partial [Candidatus Gracilibacteria bacterium]|nr:excinuclease ABC subunit UvrC [Candidatus Gracilibacteria bacterium]
SGQQNLNFAKKKMVGKIVDLKYIVTNNETESLILENDLIKKHQPKYNILLKDDKNFLYIKITHGEYPQIIRTRISPSNIKKSDGKYYGPYISGYHVNEIFKLLKKAFGYGVGSHNFFMKKGSYNLDKYIFKGNIDEKEQKIREIYKDKVMQIQHFLSGNSSDIKQMLQEDMKRYADNMQFEEAQKRKISLEALESLDSMQIVRDGVKGDFMVIQILEKYENIYVGIIDIIDSKIAAYENYEVKNMLEDSSQDILKNIVEQKWSQNRERKSLSFIVPEQINKLDDSIFHEVPQMGAKFELLKLCYKNIYEYAHKKHIDSLSTKSYTKKTMQSLLKTLSYKEINKDLIFECNDISHLSGTHSVASRSVIENGKRNPKKYKKFQIKTLSQGKIDDFGSMEEIMLRRIAELKKIGNYPDLIVIDGGKGQLGAVMKILESSDIDVYPQVVSIAKREEELFLPGQSESILLDKESNELRMIQALRDEAHRFAISFNRDSRAKAQKQNLLESIPGIGPKTRKKILSLYGSVAGIKEVSKKELIEALGITVTENLENHGLM